LNRGEKKELKQKIKKKGVADFDAATAVGIWVFTAAFIRLTGKLIPKEEHKREERAILKEKREEREIQVGNEYFMTYSLHPTILDTIDLITHDNA